MGFRLFPVNSVFAELCGLRYFWQSACGRPAPLQQVAGGGLRSRVRRRSAPVQPYDARVLPPPRVGTPWAAHWEQQDARRGGENPAAPKEHPPHVATHTAHQAARHAEKMPSALRVTGHRGNIETQYACDLWPIKTGLPPHYQILRCKQATHFGAKSRHPETTERTR